MALVWAALTGTATSIRFESTTGGPNLVFDSNGNLQSVRDEEGREYVGRSAPFVRAQLKGGTAVLPASLVCRKSELVFDMERSLGEVRLSVVPFAGGWSFTVAAAPTNVASLVMACIRPEPSLRYGTFVNAASDVRGGVVLRGCDTTQEMGASSADGLTVTAFADRGLTGRRAVLTAGPRTDLPRLLRALTEASGVPHSVAGGAWSGDAEANRGSYVFATWADAPSLGDWISLCEKGGIDLLHFHAWWKTWGHYDVDTHCFGSMEGLADAVSRVHAAGLRAGMHTLTGCIRLGDAWTVPVVSSNVIATARYSLARPLGMDDRELYVREPPVMEHETVYAESCNGNILRIDGELVQYEGVRREAPYAFTGLVRGAFGTRRCAPRPIGTHVDYVQQRYGALYPDPDSTLADALADAIADKYNRGKFDAIYFDGAEGMRSRYGIETMRTKIFERLHAGSDGIVNESSFVNPFNWWFRSRVGAWDIARWGAKRFHDRHLRSVLDFARRDNFTEVNLGWWSLGERSDDHRDTFIDELEYFAAKNAAYDVSMSVQDVLVSDRPLGFAQDRQLTVLGWWERPRLARAFNSEPLARLRMPGVEARLRQDIEGLWRISPATCVVHRSVSPLSSRFALPEGAYEQGEFRVEALHSADMSVPGRTVFGAEEVGLLTCEMAAGLTAPRVSRRKDAEHGVTWGLCVTNRNADTRAAWAVAARTFEAPWTSVENAFGLWVKGDESGALLNIVFGHPAQFYRAASEHYIRLDYRGWRYHTFLLRERDAAQHDDYVWPYGEADPLTTPGMVFGTPLDRKRVGSVKFFVNDIPAGHGVDVECSALQTFPVHSLTFDNPVLTIGGVRFPLPSPMRSGEYAELADGHWTLFSAMGEPLRRIPVDRPVPHAGVAVFSADCSTDFPRAELAFFGIGAGEPALKGGPYPRRMDIEYAEPLVYAPSRGFGGEMTVAPRPGETAQLTCEILGPVARPTVLGRMFPVCLRENERLRCTNGVDWVCERVVAGEIAGDNRVKASSRVQLASGCLADPLPRLCKPLRVTVESSDPSNASARVTFIKRYETMRKTDVLFFFDAEDFTSDRANDSVRDLANLCTEEGVCGHFALVGYLADRFVHYRRSDVLAALKPHVIGTQSLYHSVHPNVIEKSDVEDFAAAYRDVRADESRGVGMIERATGSKLLCAVPPGDSKSYVAMYAYADMGIPYYCDTVVSDGEDGDISYCNMRQLPYTYSFMIEDMLPERSAEEPDYKAILDSLVSRRRVLLFMHPNTALFYDFWDSLNYDRGNLAEFGKWKLPRPRPESETRLFYTRLRGLIRALKADPRFNVTNLRALPKERARTAIVRQDLPRLAAHYRSALTPISSPSWCVADVFQAVVRFLRDEVPGTPGKVKGFLASPQGVASEVTVRREDLIRAAHAIDLDGFLPSSLRVGDVTIGPADFLVAALETLTSGATTVTVIPREQLGDLSRFKELRDFRPRGDWIHPPEFKDAYTSDRLRLQLWTLRYVESEN